MKKKLILLPVFALLLSSCSIEDLMFWKKKDNNPQDEQKEDEKPGEDEGEKEIHVSSVSLNKSTLTLEEMKSEKLTYTVLPSDAKNKDVEWSTSDGTVASVVDGLVTAANPGSATITVTTVDGNKTASCDVTVTAKPIDVDTVTRTLNFHQYCTDVLEIAKDSAEINDPVVVDENVSITFAKNDGNQPMYYKGSNTKKYEARPYAKNSFVVSSTDGDITEVALTFSKDNPGVNPIVPDVGTFENDKWMGKSSSIEFTIGGDSGHRRISEIVITYEGSEPDPEIDINLGVKSISEVKEYIKDHPVTKNKFGNGVNEHRMVTIKGFALAKIDLEKSKAEYGLDVSEHGKVIMADETGYIGVATKVSGDGTTLYGKVDKYACTDTAKYVVTGYLSEYLGHPEILVTSFSWDSNLNITWSPAVISEATVDIEEFYARAKNVYYNCAGHGYGEVLTLNKLKLYYTEADGQGKRYYNFTDGVKNIRVNAFNLGSISEGKNYDITGIISIKNLSPIIVAFDIKQSQDQTEIEFNHVNIATMISITDLKQIHGSQEDVDTRTVKFPEVIDAYSTIYKTTGYLTLVEEDYKYYVGISDNYIDRKDLINGKDNAMANYGISLIKNKNFWDTTEEDLYKYNPLFNNYILEPEPITVYYIVRQQRYQSGKPMWEILLLPGFLESMLPQA